MVRRLLFLCLFLAFSLASVAEGALRCLVFTSYPLEGDAAISAWTREELLGVRAALRELHGDDFELVVVSMDAKAHRDEAYEGEMARRALEIAERISPDVVFLLDDHALRSLGPLMKGRSTPLFFCGVNAHPRDYGLWGAPNVSGVLERLDYRVFFDLLVLSWPAVNKVFCLADTTWSGSLIARHLRENLGLEGAGGRYRGIQVEIRSFERVRDLSEFLDGGGLVGFDMLIYVGVPYLLDDLGKPFPFEELARLVRSRFRGVDVAYEPSGVRLAGVAMAFAVSPFRQGYQAGEMAVRALRGEIPRGGNLRMGQDFFLFFDQDRFRELGMSPPEELYLLGVGLR